MTALQTAPPAVRTLHLPGRAQPEQAPARKREHERHGATGLSRWDLFVAFFKAGLAFGGGLGIMAALEDELVRKRKVVSGEDFLAMYSLGRLVPSGTMTAVAVAYGHRFGRGIGSVVAVTAMVLPSAILTILLTAAWGTLQDGPILGMLSATLLPAALAFIVAAALKFGKNLFRPCAELVIAVVAFVAAFQFDIHPFPLLLGGGVLGVVACRGKVCQ